MQHEGSTGRSESGKAPQLGGGLPLVSNPGTELCNSLSIRLELRARFVMHDDIILRERARLDPTEPGLAPAGWRDTFAWAHAILAGGCAEPEVNQETVTVTVTVNQPSAKL